MPEIAYVNGKISPIDQAYVSIEDRGYQFGDAVYEFLTSYKGRIFAMKDHLERLERSLNALGFDPIDLNFVQKAIERTFHQANYGRAGIYLQISRGVGPRNHAFPTDTKAQIVITVRPSVSIDEKLLTNGSKVITLTDIRWQRCDIKTIQLLPNAWAKQQALDAGANDAIFLADNGIVRESTSSNIFIVNDGVLHTHPLTQNILPGITRAHIIEICNNRNIPVVQDYFDLTAMLAADEVFHTGTVLEVLPITRINSQSISNGTPGPMTQNIFKWFRQIAEA